MQRATQLILTLYGDYARHRGGELGFEALADVMDNLGLSDQALRSALSRMVRRGLLQAQRQGRRSYYSLTETGWTILVKGAEKIFRQSQAAPWDGQWDLVTYTIPESRRDLRYRLRQELSQLGYGPLDGACWVSPNDHSQEVLALASSLGEGRVQVFRASYLGPFGPQHLVRRCWDLDITQDKYRGFIGKYRPHLEAFREAARAGSPWDARECFMERFQLIHEYRRFHFYDPELPPELAPEGWLSGEAAALFNELHGLLEGKAFEYFDSIVQGRRGEASAGSMGALAHAGADASPLL
ncbi:MAG: winged helix DNA-binding protein [Chloroflexi bacterium]|nr:winged helix DNA-binding protein [Chloroflexota bacterium]